MKMIPTGKYFIDMIGSVERNVSAISVVIENLLNYSVKFLSPVRFLNEVSGTIVKK